MSGPGGGSGFKGSSTETPSQTVGDGGFYIKDQGSADANKAGYGQLWIKTGSPNDLYFVNEDGQQVRITNGSSIAAAAGGSVAADDINAGDNSVSISTTSGNITLANSLTASDGLLIPDDTLLRFGSAAAGDATIEYDEDGTNQLRFAGASAIFEQNLTASNSLEIRGNKEETNLIVTGSSLMMGTGSAYTLIVSGGAGLKIESTNEAGSVNEQDSNAILTLKDAGDADHTSAYRAYIQAIDDTDDYVWRIGDAWNGGTDLDIRAQVAAMPITIQTKAGDGGPITLSPRASVAFDIRPEGQATFSGSLTVKGDLTASQGLLIPDDQFLRLGDDSEFAVEYDEDGVNKLIIAQPSSGVQFKNNQDGTTNLEVSNETNGANAMARVVLTSQNELATNKPGFVLAAFSDAYEGPFGSQFSNNCGFLTNQGSPKLVFAARHSTGSVDFYAGGSNESNLVMRIDKDSRVFPTFVSGSSNTLFGKLVGGSLTAGGNYNILIGENVGNNLTTGSNNVAIGYNALHSEQGGSGSVAIGPFALYNQKVSGSGIANNHNIAIGENAGYNVTTGSNNVAIGPNALFSASVLHGCTAIGVGALYSLHGPEDGDAAIGWDFDDFGGTRPSVGATAVGEEAGYFTDGIDNTYIGRRAGRGDSYHNGNYNTFVGSNAGSRITGYATENILIGAYAGADFNGHPTNPPHRLITGDYNIMIGTKSDFSANDAQSQIVIGNSLVGTANTRVHIGNGTSHIYNDFNSNATWTHSSDKRQKTNIQDDTLGLNFINSLRTVTYVNKSPSEFPEEWHAYDPEDKEPMGGGNIIHGFIAQEVKEAMDKVGCDTFGGWDVNPDGRQGVSFEAFVMPLVKAVQELSAKVAELEDKLENQ